MSKDRKLYRPEAIRQISRALPHAKDSMLLDILEDLERKPAKTVGEGRDIVATIRPGTDAYDKEFVETIGRAIDKALVSLGFTRSKADKRGHKVEFVYHQFAVACEKNEDTK